MKKTIVSLLFILTLVPDAAAAPLTPADFPYCADLQGTVRAESLYQVHLSDEVMAKAAAGLHDLRLFDSTGRETPYTIIGNVPPFEAVETYPLEITAYDSDGATAIVTLKLPREHRPVTVLDLKTPDRDFKKRVVLSASSDGKAWQRIAEDSIYDFSSRVNVRKTMLEFPATDARFFRIALSDFEPPSTGGPSIKLKYGGLDFTMSGAAKKELRILSIEGRTGMPAERRPVYDRKSFSEFTGTTDKEGNTVVTFAAGLPADRFSLDVANPYFYRTVNLYGSNTGREGSFRRIARGTIYRFPLTADRNEEKNYFEQHLPKQAYYRIVVENRNNPALEIRNVTLSWVRQNLYFIALKDSERHTLCFGNPRAAQPDYDISRFINRSTLAQHPYQRLELAEIHEGGGPRVTLEERLAGMEKLILKIVVVLLVIGMGLWLYALLQKSSRSGKGS